MAENQRQQEKISERSGGKADKLFIERQSHSSSLARRILAPRPAQLNLQVSEKDDNV